MDRQYYLDGQCRSLFRVESQGCGAGRVLKTERRRALPQAWLRLHQPLWEEEGRIATGTESRLFVLRSREAGGMT